MNHMRSIVVVVAVLLLAACASSPERIVRDPAYAPVVAERYETPRPVTGSIYGGSAGLGLFGDRKARRIGDVLTIVLTENTSASNQASTNTSKESNTNLGNPTILGQPLGSLNAEIGGSRDFAGSGSSSQSNRLTGRITVSVVDVLPNGNLLVRGEKVLALNNGAESIRVSGIVRPADIGTDNTLQSTQIADAHISYRGSGTLADSNSMGWLSRVFNSPVWPF